MKRIFIDGSSGTTGLRIVDRLKDRDDTELLILSEDERKDRGRRKTALNSCDAAILCLPDDAAREAVGMVENPDTVIIDTSTAHRTQAGWTYGFPELSESMEKEIINSKRISVPGCHASGFIALIYPLLMSGLIRRDVRIAFHSVTGYSGGGKKMIKEYEAESRSPLLDAPRQYGLLQDHKHLKEMLAISGLEMTPVFCPIVADFYSGMVVTVPLFKEDLTEQKGMDDIRDIYRSKYKGPVVQFRENLDEKCFIAGNYISGRDSMYISVAGNEDRIILLAIYDNIGKGASGAAVQCLNLVVGQDAAFGLNL
jgi:N-acetyl-gamma-glutamyl-phosphate reductase